jgi:hypothetical protein
MAVNLGEMIVKLYITSYTHQNTTRNILQYQKVLTHLCHSCCETQNEDSKRDGMPQGDEGIMLRAASGTAPQHRTSRVRFPMRLLKFFEGTLQFAFINPGVHSSTNRNEDQGFTWGLRRLVPKALQTYHLRVPVFRKSWEAQPPGTLGVYGGLYRDTFSFVFIL